jgi:molybdopterin-guanine dinucleotide biosynthesis protein A
VAGTWVVVLAGGASRRFGSDKLEADLHGRTLLDATLASVPAGLPVVVVGPERPVRRSVRFVREEPPGGGPAAALVAGLSAALEEGATTVSALPGDAPAAGRAIPVLLDALAVTDLVVAHGADGQVFPLQLACTADGARRVVEAAGETRGAGASVRRLLVSLDPAPARVVLEREALLDVDTLDDLSRIGEVPTA